MPTVEFVKSIGVTFMNEDEFHAALKRIDALRDCSNTEECDELRRLTESVQKFEETFFTIGSGNVFEDLGLENPEEELRKARLSFEESDNST